jgi:AraC family transcriptional regulator
MDYRIEEKEGFEVVGAVKRISTKDGVNFKEVPAFWRQCEADGTNEKICAIAAGSYMYGLCLDFREDQTEFEYMIAADAPKGEFPGGLEKRKVPAATWAVFAAVGPVTEAVQDVTKRIYSEWFPATGYEHDDAPEIEAYPMGDTSSPGYRCEIWIPVKKK